MRKRHVKSWSCPHSAARWGGMMGAGLLGVALFAGCGREKESGGAEIARPRVGNVSTLRVQRSVRDEFMEVTGTVKGTVRADIAPKIMSKVSQVLVREGDHVRKGQVLIRLESHDLAAQVQQAEAAVAAAKAALAQAVTGHGIQRTKSATQVAQAEAALRQTEEQLSIVKEGARKQQKQQADEGVRQAEAAKAQADAGVHQAEAAVAAAKAQLSLVKEGARRQQKLQADAAVRQAEANLKTAQATYDRFKPLADQGVISKQRFDEISLRLAVARSQYETAKEQASMVHEGSRTQEIQQAEEGVRQAEAALRMAQQQAHRAEAALAAAKAQRSLTYEGARTQEVIQAEEAVKQAKEALRMAEKATDEDKIKADTVKMLRAQVSQAEAGLTAARVQLGYATIVAPFAGVITRRNVDPGAMTAPGIPVLSLVDDSGFRMDALVPERKMKGLKLGGEARITIDALGQTVTGHIRQIVPAADQATRTFIVKFGLPNVPGLVAGLFARARIPVGRKEGLFIPQTALWHEGSLVGVLAVEKGIAHRRLVTVGRKRGDEVEVLSGLSPGERIVVGETGRVPDGARVDTGGESQ